MKDQLLHQTVRSESRGIINSAVLLICFVFAINPLLAQNPDAATQAAGKSKSFDAVTIRPADQKLTEIPEGGIDGSRFYIRNLPLTSAIVYAFFRRGEVPEGFVDSLPKWIREEKYDLTAKVSPPDYEALQRESNQSNPVISREMIQPMLQTMLKERFNIVFHHAQAVTHEYSLEVEERGINSKRLKVSTPSESIPSDAVSYGGAWQTTYTKAADGFDEQRTFYNMTMAEFARHVSSAVVVHDDTGLSARYDFTVELRDNAHDPSERYDVSPLGLKWKKTDKVSDSVVIDHIDRPTPN